MVRQRIVTPSFAGSIPVVRPTPIYLKTKKGHSGRKGDRVAEGVTLEMLCTGNCTEGSNPSLSVGDVAEW